MDTPTTYLLSRVRTVSEASKCFRNATVHPFLTRAGEGTVSQETLVSWLKQDTVYTRGYISFVGGLLGHLGSLLPPLKVTSPPPGKRNAFLDAFDLLVEALTNLHRETGFFESVVDECRLLGGGEPLEQPVRNKFGALGEIIPNDASQAYLDLFKSFCTPVPASHTSERQGETIQSKEKEEASRELLILKGLTVLWATEYCYLTAWRHAASHMPKNGGDKSPNPATAALHDKFIPNWTDPLFAEFVQRCGDTLDEVFDMLHHHHKRNESWRSDALQTLQNTWDEVVMLEEGFWPDGS